jgi:hypothetical protein
MPTNYDGLTRNIWPGTWSTGTNSPIALDTELRGTLQSISGDSGDRLTNIPGARIQEGMLVYLKTGYTAGGTTRLGDKYYTYKLNAGEYRNETGAVPNAESNWTQAEIDPIIKTYNISGTNQVTIDSIDSTIFNSAKYEAQISSPGKFQSTELKLLISKPNVFLTEYGTLGDFLGTFSSYYSPAVNNYSSPNINIGGVSLWNGTQLRIYTTTNQTQLGLLSIVPGTTITLTDNMSNIVTAILQSPFVETGSGIYDANTTISKSPTFLINNIAWTGTGNVELRYKPINSSTTVKFTRHLITV